MFARINNPFLGFLTPRLNAEAEVRSRASQPAPSPDEVESPKEQALRQKRAAAVGLGPDANPAAIVQAENVQRLRGEAQSLGLRADSPFNRILARRALLNRMIHAKLVDLPVSSRWDTLDEQEPQRGLVLGLRAQSMGMPLDSSVRDLTDEIHRRLESLPRPEGYTPARELVRQVFEPLDKQLLQERAALARSYGIPATSSFTRILARQAVLDRMIRARLLDLPMGTRPGVLDRQAPFRLAALNFRAKQLGAHPYASLDQLTGILHGQLAELELPPGFTPAGEMVSRLFQPLDEIVRAKSRKLGLGPSASLPRIVARNASLSRRILARLCHVPRSLSEEELNRVLAARAPGIIAWAAPRLGLDPASTDMPTLMAHIDRRLGAVDLGTRFVPVQSVVDAVFTQILGEPARTA